MENKKLKNKIILQNEYILWLIKEKDEEIKRQKSYIKYLKSKLEYYEKIIKERGLNNK